MKTTKEFRDFILEQLRALENITCRPMMGEYLLYHDGILFGGLYNNRLLIKVCETNDEFGMRKDLPYNGAKLMYNFEELDDTDLLKTVVLATCEGLTKKKK